MTLAELIALDPAALWDALPREQQMAIVVPLLRSEFATVTMEDDGTDACDDDKNAAAHIGHCAFQEAMDALGVAFPQILGDDLTALRDGPTADMLDGQGRVHVKGLQAARKLYRSKALGLHVRIGDAKVGIVGFKNLATEDAPVWEAWTQDHVDAERHRRHPEMAQGGDDALAA